MAMPGAESLRSLHTRIQIWISFIYIFSRNIKYDPNRFADAKLTVVCFNKMKYKYYISSGVEYWTFSHSSLLSGMYLFMLNKVAQVVHAAMIFNSFMLPFKCAAVNYVCALGKAKGNMKKTKAGWEISSYEVKVLPLWTLTLSDMYTAVLS